jgi:CHAT domain-containing protein
MTPKKRHRARVFGAAILLQLLGTAGARAIEPQNSPTGRKEPFPHEQQLLRTANIDPFGPWHDHEQTSPSNEDPAAILQQAVHLADLYNWADAAPLFERAEELYKSRSDSRNALYAHLGKIRSTMEQLALPEVSAELGAELETDPLLQSDKQLRLFCLVVKGDIDGEIDATPSRRDWEEALQIATELGDAKWKNRVSGEIGFAMFLQGDVMSARQKVAGALIGASALRDAGAQMRYLAAIGTALVFLGSYDDGISYFDKASKIAQANPDAGYPFLIESGRVQALKGMGKLEDAQRLADEIIAQARAHQKHVKETQALITASTIARAKHDDDQAIGNLQNAIDLADRGGYKRLLTHAQFELADIYRSQGRMAEAEELVSIAAQITLRIGDIYLVPGRLQALGDLEVSQRQYDEADATYDRASDILDTMIGNVTATSAKSGLITAMSEIYTKHFALLIDELHNTAKGYSVLERARGRVITDLLMSGKRPDTPQEREIEREIGRLNLDLSKAKTKDEIRKIRDRIFLAEQARWLAPGSNSWKSHPMDPIALDTVKRSLSANEVVLEYVLADPRSYCLAITRDNVHVVELPSRRTIETLVVAFLTKIKAKQSASAEANQVYNALLKDIAETTKEHWIIVPDGRLHLLPFDALQDKNGQYLVNSHTITYAPSASSVYLMNSDPLLRRRPKYSLLAVGGISYDQRPDVSKLAITAGYVRGGLSELPGSKQEVLAAIAALNSRSNTLLLGSEGTESAFKHAQLDEFEIIHLAVHGVADEKHPDHAALMLLSDPAAGEDGILQPFEIMQLHTNAEVVVLSACDTAVGRLQGEEGISNISQAFLLAGARNVISTLWSTDDIFSSYLMKRFYARLAASATIASSLTGAKREVLRTYGKEAVPYYWAGFTLEGLGNHPISSMHSTRHTHANAHARQATQVAHAKGQSEDSQKHPQAGPGAAH